jgi:hypothetical protein
LVRFFHGEGIWCCDCSKSRPPRTR